MPMTSETAPPKVMVATTGASRPLAPCIAKATMTPTTSRMSRSGTASVLSREIER